MLDRHTRQGPDPAWPYLAGALVIPAATLGLNWVWMTDRETGAVIAQGRAIDAESCASCHGAEP
jgi:mono/diheme cytochrome c family protein